MLASSKLIAFVATTDAARSRAFYENILGLTFVADDPFALAFDANGVMIRMFKLDDFTPAPWTVLGWDVADIDFTIEQMTGSGIAFERFPGMQHEENGVWISPSGAKVAWFKDPDGNVLSLTQF